MARAPKKVRRWRVGVFIRRRLERLHTGRFLREPVRRQDVIVDVSVLRPRGRTMGRRRPAALPHYGNLWQRRAVFWGHGEHLLVRKDGARQHFCFLGEAFVRGPRYAETTGVLRRRCQPAQRDSVYGSAKST